MKNTIPGEMTAVLVDPEDGHLYTKKVEVPVPKEGEVLVKMLAAPINPSDLAKIREVRAEDTGDFIPGIEGCGIVVASGKGLLPRLFMGKRVACSSKYTTSGTWAEYMVTKAGSCFPVGKAISDEQASMTLVNPMTALAFLNYARKNRHQAVVNTAASGALGKMIATLLKKHHIDVLNIVRSEEALHDLKKQGTRHVLNSAEPDFPVKLKEWCEKMHAGLVLDAVGGAWINSVLDYLPVNSTILLYGNLSQEKVHFLPIQLLRESKKMVGFFLGHWVEEQGMFKTILNLRKVNGLLKGGMETRVQAVLPLQEIQKAVEMYEGNMSGGKVLLKVN